MNAEIRLVRNDNTPWGFRLTGGKDFESPFFVVKVMGKSIAERAGLRVGDMVWAINYKSTEPYTHKDSQRIIYESENKLILNIRRGCPMVSGRGTPLPEYTEPLMEVDLPPPPPPPPAYPVQPIYVPPYYPQQQLPIQQVRPLSPPKILTQNQYESTMTKYESTTFKSIETSEQIIKEPEVVKTEEDDEEEGVEVESSWNVTIKPSGKITQIEEVDTPPSGRSSRASSRSRKSRSRSPSRERKKSILKTSSESPKLIAHYTSEILDQENVVAKTSTEQKQSRANTSTAEEIKKAKEISEVQKQVKDKTQLTDDDIAEMMSGEAEVLDEGVIGINFQKFIPKVDFIKDSQVLQALQEEHFHKEEPEEKQLAKEPTKRFSTFLQIPKRPIPKPKPRQDNVEDLPWKRKLLSPTPNAVKQQKINDTHQEQEQHQQQSSEDEKGAAIVASASQKEMSDKADVTEAMVVEESEDTRIKNIQDIKEINTTGTEHKDKASEIEDSVISSETQDNETNNGDIIKATGSVHVDDDNDDDEKKSVHFEDEVDNSTKKQESQSTTEDLHKSIMLDLENCKDDFERQLAQIQHQLSTIENMPEEIRTHLLEIQQQLFNIVKLKTTVEQEQAERERRLREEQEEEVRRKAAEEEERRKAEEEEERRKAEEEERKKVEEEERRKVEDEAAKAESQHQTDGIEYGVAPQRRKELLQTPQVRPIVLPGGKKWRKPQDAYNDEFIAETLVGMSEVIVGTTIGVNFWKYVPPKFDTANSAVYRLIEENEARCKGIAGRPEKVLAEEDYYPAISKRHFYAAKLAEMALENAAQQPLEPGA